MTLCRSAMTALAYSAIMDGKLEVEPQTWVLAATRRQLNKCHEPSEYLIWTSRSAAESLPSVHTLAESIRVYREQNQASDTHMRTPRCVRPSQSIAASRQEGIDYRSS